MSELDKLEINAEPALDFDDTTVVVPMTLVREVFERLEAKKEEWRGKYEILKSLAASHDPSASDEYYGTFDEVLAALSEASVDFRKAFALLGSENEALLGALADIAYSEDMTLEVAQKKAARLYSFYKMGLVVGPAEMYDSCEIDDAKS